ncbi:MAG: hypothetical protein R3F43_26965 [bacterium]
MRKTASPSTSTSTTTTSCPTTCTSAGGGGAGGQEPAPGVGLSGNREASQQVPRPDGPVPIPNHAIQVVSEEHALDRMRYFMGQATAELKSRHPADDVCPRQPGAAAGREKLRGIRARRRPQRRAHRPPRPPAGLGEHQGAQGAHVGAGGRPRRRSPPAAQEGRPAGAGPGSRAVRRPDDALRERASAARAGGARHERRPGGRWERHAELKAAYKIAHIAYWKWLEDRPLLILFPACTIPPSHARKKLRERAESG